LAQPNVTSPEGNSVISICYFAPVQRLNNILLNHLMIHRNRILIIQSELVDLNTATGTMRTYTYRPQAQGQYPCIIFYSEIFQQTAPIARTAAILAGHGFVVLVPEVFHELNPIGTVLGYDDAGKDKGNNDKWAKPLEHHDSDTQALVEFAKNQSLA